MPCNQLGVTSQSYLPWERVGRRSGRLTRHFSSVVLESVSHIHRCALFLRLWGVSPAPGFLILSLTSKGGHLHEGLSLVFLFGRVCSSQHLCHFPAPPSPGFLPTCLTAPWASPSGCSAGDWAQPTPTAHAFHPPPLLPTHHPLTCQVSPLGHRVSPPRLR